MKRAASVQKSVRNIASSQTRNSCEETKPFPHEKLRALDLIVLCLLSANPIQRSERRPTTNIDFSRIWCPLYRKSSLSSSPGLRIVLRLRLSRFPSKSSCSECLFCAAVNLTPPQLASGLIDDCAAAAPTRTWERQTRETERKSKDKRTFLLGVQWKRNIFRQKHNNRSIRRTGFRCPGNMERSLWNASSKIRTWDWFALVRAWIFLWKQSLTY